MAFAAIGSIAVSAYTAYSANSNAKKAEAQGAANAARTEKAATEATNRANQKQVNSSALLSSNQLAAKGGQSGTMLTGPVGVDPGSLSLGKTTLLGGGGG